ncbi:MAG TPA: helix-turn-helix domain-containing protein [Phycisphaerales bacterium]
MARFTIDYIREMYAAMPTPPPTVLTLGEAASLARVAPSTLKRWVAEGRIRTSVKRGKPIRFLRDAFTAEFMGMGDKYAPRRRRSAAAESHRATGGSIVPNENLED